jgi:hypothetical protein
MWNLVGEPIKELEINPNLQEGEKKNISPLNEIGFANL